jgi:hypothetical protein
MTIVPIVGLLIAISGSAKVHPHRQQGGRDLPAGESPARGRGLSTDKEGAFSKQKTCYSE